jgi:hypothetical protein
VLSVVYPQSPTMTTLTVDLLGVQAIFFSLFCSRSALPPLPFSLSFACGVLLLLFFRLQKHAARGKN